MIELVPFLAASVVIILVPGPDIALVTRNSINGGRRDGIMTATGVFFGVIVWAMVSAAGLAVILEKSSYAYSVVRIAGAVYLAFLGTRALLNLRKRPVDKLKTSRNSFAVLDRVSSPALQGALNNILNPKMAILFVSLLPQFITSGTGQVLASFELAIFFDIIAFLWLLFFTIAVATGKRFMESQPIRNSFEAASGIALISLGLSVGLRSR